MRLFFAFTMLLAAPAFAGSGMPNAIDDGGTPLRRGRIALEHPC